MKKMRKEFIDLLNIYGVSGDEKAVRKFIQPKLTKLMDKVFVDSYGNLLGEKKVGTGVGSCIMLNAHMDTVKGVLADRKLVIESDTITSNKGCLGADDRAGIAIVLSVLRNIHKTSFNGIIKVSFTKEEEVGCLGSSKINKSWYEDVDLSITVDRKGNRDIVVGSWNAFCSNYVGDFMENVAELTGMSWKCVEGGISDAVTFSENGINSINISAGYKGEHTELEMCSIKDMKDSVKLIMQTLASVNGFSHTFGKVPKENFWVKDIYTQKNNYSQEYFENIWGYEEDNEIFVYEDGIDVILSQGYNEIVISRESVKSIMNQLASRGL